MGEAKRRRASGRSGPPASSMCIPLTAEAINTAMRVAHEAANEESGPDPRQFRVPLDQALEAYQSGLRITDDPGAAARRDQQTVGLTNNIDNRIGMALMVHFEGDANRVASAMTRMFSLTRRLKDPDAEPWIKGEAAHRAVFEVAGSLPITAITGRFDRQEFWAAVAARAGRTH